MGRKKKELIEISKDKTEERKTINPNLLEKTQLELYKKKIEIYNLKIDNIKLEKSLEIKKMNELINTIRKNNNISLNYILDLETNNFNIKS